MRANSGIFAYYCWVVEVVSGESVRQKKLINYKEIET